MYVEITPGKSVNMGDIYIQILEAQWKIKGISTEKFMLRFVISKLLKTKVGETS